MLTSIVFHVFIALSSFATYLSPLNLVSSVLLSKCSNELYLRLLLVNGMDGLVKSIVCVPVVTSSELLIS
jgi:hypothetical protein